MSYHGVPHNSYPPAPSGYGTQYPPPIAAPPTGYPAGPPPPGYGAYPPPVVQGYPPPQYYQQGGYQGYFSDGFPPPPPQPYPPPTQVYHCDHYHHCEEDGCFSVLKGCLAALCCCCMLEECFF